MDRDIMSLSVVVEQAPDRVTKGDCLLCGQKTGEATIYVDYWPMSGHPTIWRRAHLACLKVGMGAILDGINGA